jgi:F-type H+-transporting ATPase subunit gamma
MPSLKDLKNRIENVKSTRKITSAMKMVAASKLRRAQEQAEAGRPYADRMGRMLAVLSAGVAAADAPRLLAGTGRDDVRLLVVVSSDRGLCGGFNSTIVREARRRIRQLEAEGKTVKLFCIGRKGRDSLRRDYAKLMIESMEDVGRRKLTFADASKISTRLLALFEEGAFDRAEVIFNRFKSVISQIVTVETVIPFVPPAADAAAGPGALVEFEPDEATILEDLLPRNLSVQMYKALLESAASEQGARMSAMDNATRNAGDMITKLTLNYNRTRQAYITKELIEIISGAEAV